MQVFKMIKADKIKNVKKIIKSIQKKGKSIGFVPTMGTLHKGHLSLIKKARRECDFLVVSIFVNPLQFGPKDDLEQYPRVIERDESLLRKEDVDLLFLPKTEEMYKSDHSVYVKETFLSKVLCGRSRKGHFDGVCTVLVKLFNIVEPDKVYFGQKDYQQALIVKRLASNLNFPALIKIMPIVREKDKLAMSSRNTYLNSNERKASICLYKALMHAKKLIDSGECNVSRIIREIKRVVLSNRFTTIDYAEIVDLENLQPIEKIEGKALIALAVYVGRVRLIDNIIVYAKKK
jgi:pantoate--beta-alanine ligase